MSNKSIRSKKKKHAPSEAPQPWKKKYTPNAEGPKIKPD